MTRTFGQVIASRELSHAESDTPIVVEIGVPQRRRTGEWACPYRITGLGKRCTRYAFGYDAVQALQIVNQAIWLDLEPHREQLDWLGERGNTGFFRYYPQLLGADHQRRVEAAIDSEIHREYLRLKRRHDRRLARRKAHKKRATSRQRGVRRPSHG